MLEITIAVCPPEGERRVVLTGKIENCEVVAPGESSKPVRPYRYTFRVGETEKTFHLPLVDSSRGVPHIVGMGLSILKSRFGGLLRNKP